MGERKYTIHDTYIGQSIRLYAVYKIKLYLHVHERSAGPVTVQHHHPSLSAPPFCGDRHSDGLAYNGATCTWHVPVGRLGSMRLGSLRQCLLALRHMRLQLLLAYTPFVQRIRPARLPALDEPGVVAVPGVDREAREVVLEALLELRK